MHTRLLEIHRKVDIHLQEVLKLRSEEAAILEMIQNQSKETVTDLFFDEQRQTIRWADGMVKLSRKQFSLMKTLWNNDERTETLAEIESSIWNEVGSEDKPFVEKNTIFALVSRLRNSVSDVGFPYEIVGVKNSETSELQGYCLVRKE
ncbi:MAG: winged helix-turn-helix domain-containing protein [Planctomycetaceae bacterium]|jgi:DNA-binding response OmpR family regulator|nr:winged helix-turn-helix domain-containing protein [Planctomycetaceae bacterium]